uniref:Uncharacterized protein n=1 Tax=Romanomermis culicivorax TaxID=13658 RepID=A0A915JM80_ROMCU
MDENTYLTDYSILRDGSRTLTTNCTARRVATMAVPVVQLDKNLHGHLYCLSCGRKRYSQLRKVYAYAASLVLDDLCDATNGLKQRAKGPSARLLTASSGKPIEGSCNK